MNLRSLAVCAGVVLAGLSAVGWVGNTAIAEVHVQEAPHNAAALTAEQAGPYFALLIGINDYQHLPKLKTAVHDSESMAELLQKQYGFETQVLRNPTRDQIKRALNVYRRELERNSNLLIYYAGHGFYDKEADKAYWLPADAEPGDTTNWIIADEITTDAKVMPARHVLIVSDSCYSGGIGRGVTPEFTPQESSRYLEKMMEGKSRTLMASGGLEPVSDEGGRGHSVFAAAFMGALTNEDEPAFSAQILFERSVRVSVAGRSDQTPEYTVIRNSGHDAGDFVFLRTTPASRTQVAENMGPKPKGSTLSRSPGKSGSPKTETKPEPETESEPESEPTRSVPAADTPPNPEPAGDARPPDPTPEPVSAPATEPPKAVATAVVRPEFGAMKLAFSAGIAAMNIANQIREEARAQRDETLKAELRQKRATSCKIAVARFQEAEKAAPHENQANVMSVEASNHAIVWANLGRAYECLGNYDDAIVSFRKAAALRPQASYYAHLSEDQAHEAVATHDPAAVQERTARANLNCERAAAIDPNAGAVCWKNIGIVYYKSLSLKQAVPALRKATEADPTDAQAWYMLGNALAGGITSERQGTQTFYTIPAGTRKAFQHCIAVDPNGSYAKACRGGLQAVNGMAVNPAASTGKQQQ